MGDRFGELVSVMALRVTLVDRNPFWPCYNKLLDVLLISAIDSVHSVNKSTKKCSNGNSQKRKVIPGWSEYVESHRKQALFWHQI